ncbi:hypothetical protein K523DRAFT_420752 [Schizophyllum commune Tattone D]|nr:hypothetical protein K523DRAFT_420752 [Schizophyllum commune Tattone D]
MRPIPAEHPSQPGDQPDASTDEEAMSLDETADEESESSSDELTTTDEDEESIELCPYCEDSVSYNTFFEPTLHSREQLRSGYTPSAHSCRRLIERAEAAEEQAAQLYDETRRLQSLMKELHHRRRLLFGQALELYLYALKLCGPLRATVDICDDLDLEREVDILPAIIFKNLSRCRSIEAPDRAIRYLGVQAPLNVIMEHLEAVTVTDSEDTVRAEPHSLFRHTPRLKVWKQLQEEYRAMPAALSNLVHLEMEWSNAVRVHAIISQCPRLEHCNISLYTLSDAVDPSAYVSSFTLPYLETLQVMVSPPRATLRRLFGALSAPRLKHASFYHVASDYLDFDLLLEDGAHWPQQDFYALLRRSNCRLTSLELLAISLTQQEVSRLREQLPTKTKLIVVSGRSIPVRHRPFPYPSDGDMFQHVEPSEVE